MKAFFDWLQVLFYMALLLSLVLDAPFLAEIPMLIKGVAFLVLIAAVFSGLYTLTDELILHHERESDTKIPDDPQYFGERDTITPKQLSDRGKRF